MFFFGEDTMPRMAETLEPAQDPFDGEFLSFHDQKKTTENRGGGVGSDLVGVPKDSSLELS